MGILDRIMLVVYALLLILVSLAMMVVAAGWRFPLDWLAGATLVPEGQIVAGALSLIVFAVSVRFLWFGCRRQVRRITVASGELGGVQVSLAAVEHLVGRVARHLPGVRDVRPRVSIAREQLAIRVRVSVSADVRIPDLSLRMQQAIQSEVRELIGIEVGSVEVTVDSFSDGARRGRVESVG